MLGRYKISLMSSCLELGHARATYVKGTMKRQKSIYSKFIWTSWVESGVQLTQIALQPISGDLESNKISGGACPLTPLGGAHVSALLLMLSPPPNNSVLEPPLLENSQCTSCTQIGNVIFRHVGRKQESTFNSLMVRVLCLGNSSYTVWHVPDPLQNK